VAPQDADVGRTVRRQRALLVILVVALVVSVAGLVAVWRIKSPSQQAADQAPPSPSVLTAPVRQDVLAQQAILRGQVEADSAGVRSLMQLSPAIVTALPVAAGARVAEGDVVAEVSGRPLFVLSGDVPDYRTMGPATAGKDIRELQAALKRLGLLTASFKDGTFDQATTVAVSKLYKEHGYAPFCYGAVTDVCLGEVVFVSSLPATVGTLAVKVGDDASSGTSLLTLELGEATVSGLVPGGQQSGLVAGLRVLVADDVSQRQCQGTLTKVGAYAAATSDSGGVAGYPVTVSAPGCLDAAWVGLNVRLVIDVQSSDAPVLIVPTSAIQTDADGTTYVMVHDAGAPDRRVGVTTGLVAGGEVAVTPDDGGSLNPGDAVVTG